MWWSKLKVGDRLWLGFCLSLLVFLLFPALGALGLVVTLVVIWCQNYRQLTRSFLCQALGILTGLLILSSALAEYSQEAWLGLANFLPYFLLFIAFRWLIRQPAQLRQLSWILIVPCLPIVILGLGQLFLAWDTISLTESVLGWELVPGGVPPDRMSSVFIYANFLAIYLAIAFTLTLGLWIDTWQQKFDLLRQILLSVMLLADVSGIVLTSSRNAWVICILIFVAYALYLGWNWLVWGILGSAIAIVWAAFVPNLGGRQLRYLVPNFIWMRLADSNYDRPIETLRITQWHFCWNLIKERPLFGWGLRNFTPLYEAKMNLWLGHPHNLFLMFGAEAGIIALLLFLAIVATIMFQAAKLLLTSSSPESSLIFFSYLIAFSACILFNLADVSIFDLRVNTLGWILLAAISGVTSSQLSKNEIN